MNWGYAGQLVTVFIIGWGLSEIVCSILWHRKQQKIASQERLKSMIDRFTKVNGERYEDEVA